jgi:hypothetical protein
VVLKKSELVIDKEKTATHSVEVSICRRIASTLLAKKTKKIMLQKLHEKNWIHLRKG